MSTFALTFGVKYAHEPHPVAPNLVHPDGYVTIITEDEEQARRIACSNFGQAWAFLYPEGRLSAKSYPLGELAVLFDLATCLNCGEKVYLAPEERDARVRWAHRITGDTYCAGSYLTATPNSSTLTRHHTEQDPK